MSAGQPEANELTAALQETVATTKEQRDLLVAIKAVSENIRLEITGGAGFPGEDGLGLAENNSLKQVQEEILFQLKAMNKNIEDLPSKIEESLKIQMQEAITKLEAKKQKVSAKSGFYPAVKIFSDKSSWNKFWTEEATRMKQHLRIPVDGISMKGTNLVTLAQTIPNPPIKLMDWLPQKKFPTEDAFIQRFNRCRWDLEQKKPILIEISNRSDYNFDNPNLFINTDCVYHPMPIVINPGTTEMMSFYVTREIQGLCSYDISALNCRLVIRLDYSFPFHSPRWIFSFGLAFTPMNVPADEAMFTKQKQKIATTEFNFDHDDGYKLIHNKNLLVTGDLAVEGGVNCIVLRVQVLECIQKQSEHIQIRQLTDGLTISRILDRDSLSRANVGCVIEIANKLNVMLQDFKWHIDRGAEYVLLPPIISSFSREMFYVLDDTSTKGMISHKIENTDLRMAVVFWTRPEGNQFACGFISSDFPTDATTMESLVVSENWKTRPYIYANAQDGEQILEYRTLRIKAVMGTAALASLKLIITAF